MPPTDTDILAALLAKLDGMQLHDNTGHPRDEGYQSAVDELRAWAHSQPAAVELPAAPAGTDAEHVILAWGVNFHRLGDEHTLLGVARSMDGAQRLISQAEGDYHETNTDRRPVVD